MGASAPQLLQVLDRAVEMGQQSQQDKRIGQIEHVRRAGGAAAPRARDGATRCRTSTSCRTPSC